MLYIKIKFENKEDIESYLYDSDFDVFHEKLLVETNRKEGYLEIKGIKINDENVINLSEYLDCLIRSYKVDIEG